MESPRGRVLVAALLDHAMNLDVNYTSFLCTTGVYGFCTAQDGTAKHGTASYSARVSHDVPHSLHMVVTNTFSTVRDGPEERVRMYQANSTAT